MNPLVAAVTEGARRRGLCVAVREFEATTRTADEVLRLTGFAVGGVPPFGHTVEIPVYINADLFHHAVVWAAAGTPHAVFSVTPGAPSPGRRAAWSWT